MQRAAQGLFGWIPRLIRGPQERQALDYLLAHADPNAPLSERVAWLTELLRWVRVHRPPASAKASDTGEAPARDESGEDVPTRDPVLRVRVARIRFLLQLIDRHPEWKSALARTLRSVLRDSHGLRLFTTTGLPQEYGFWGEAARRVAAKVLPDPPAFADLAQVFVALFPDRGDETMPLALPADTNARLGALFGYDEAPDEACWAVIRRDIDDAAAVLATQVAAIGLSDAIRRRASPVALDMLRSAGKGGALTGITVCARFGLVGHGLAPFVEGFVASLNYALSFCAIQFVHGTLATKQPAMTAATLAATLKHGRGRGRLRGFVAEVANLTRSQVAAIAGNLAVVVPSALLIEFAWESMGGGKLPRAEKASATIASLNVLGATPVYAAFTGVLLWVSAVLSGGIENWAVYRRLPEALAYQPRLVHAFGPEAMQRAAQWFERNVAGLGGSVALGFLLGMTPVVAAFFGIPLDVRHVTLSTGSLALSASTLGTTVFGDPAFWLACAGIAVVGVLNLGVSFSLALMVAIRATRPRGLSRRRVYRAVLARLVTSPRDFLLPPRRIREAVAQA